jgi:hypothetical protein
MQSAHEFYIWLNALEDDTVKPKRGRRAKNKQYFTVITENAIIAYNNEPDDYERDKLYRDYIHQPFDKLVENIYHTFHFSYFDIPYEDIKSEVVAFLNEKIHKYQHGKGKAFSYFSIIAKNYLIIQNNQNYAKLKGRAEVDEVDDSRDLYGELSLSTQQELLKDFIEQWTLWYDQHLNLIFTNKKDIIIADAILALFKIRENIEDFNKKALYIMIRERTGLKTQNITKVINIMRQDFVNMYTTYQKTGRIIRKI